MSGVEAADPALETPLRVLAVYGEARVLPAAAAIQDGLLRALHEEDIQAEVVNEFLETDYAEDASFAESAGRDLETKFTGHPVQALVAVGPVALATLLKVRERSFRHLPLLHLHVPPSALQTLELPDDVVGIPYWPDPLPLIEQLPKLHPRASRLVVIGGSGGLDRAMLASLDDAAARLPGHWRVDTWQGLGMDEVLSGVESLAAESVVISPGIALDGDGRIWHGRMAFELIVGRSAAPVYAMTSTHLGGGAVGAHMTPLDELGYALGQLLVRRLQVTETNRTRPAAAPVQRFYFDQRALQRWGIGADALPSDSVLLFPPPNLWRDHADEIALLGLVFLLQAFALAWLLLERRRRRRSERGWAESKQQLQLAIDAAGLGFWSWARQSKECWLSVQVASWLGLEGAGPHSELQTVLQAVHPDDRQALVAQFNAALDAGGAFHFRCRVQGGDSPRHIESWGTPTETGAAVFGVSLDVTSRVQSEQEQSRQRSEIAHLTRVGMLGQLSGALAHELNQPLSAIQSNAEALRLQIKAGRYAKAEALATLDDVIDENQRAAAIIRRLHALFRREPEQYQPIELDSVLRAVARLIRTELVTHGIAFDYQPASSALTVCGDEIQLQQVLLNLLLNAQQAMLGATESPRLQLRTERVGADKVDICVVDNGPGAGHDLQQLFEPFYSTRSGGLGMGLALSRSIAEAHGGTLTAEPAIDTGLCLRLRLPTVPGKAM